MKSRLNALILLQIPHNYCVLCYQSKCCGVRVRFPSSALPQPFILLIVVIINPIINPTNSDANETPYSSRVGGFCYLLGICQNVFCEVVRCYFVVFLAA
jgi:hypothetical protein